MKLAILLIMIGCFGVIMAVMNRHPMLCVGGIVILVNAVLRIRMVRNKAKITPE